MKYNHTFDLAFQMTSETKDGSDITDAMLMAALLARLARLAKNNELGEACGPPYDTEAISQCDCCGKNRPLAKVWYGNIETYACAECRGERYEAAADRAKMPDGSISVSRYIAECDKADKS